MLSYKETEDIDARFSEVERTVTAWRAAIVTANPDARQEFNNRLRISLIHHDAALEGEVLSYSEIKAAVVESGMYTLRRSGLEKVKQGQRSIEEVIRVTFAD